MKASALKRGVTLLAALLIVLVSVVPVLSAGTVRVFVEFKPGSQAAVRAELQRAGAEIHYQFDRLQSFVVSVPERALAGLSRNPNVVSIEADPVRELVRNMPAPCPNRSCQSRWCPTASTWCRRATCGMPTATAWSTPALPPAPAARSASSTPASTPDHEDFVGRERGRRLSQRQRPCPGTYDGYGHGTHVAGTIVAANNSLRRGGRHPRHGSAVHRQVFGDDGLWVSRRIPPT